MIALWTCLGLAGGYITLSVIFLRFPTLIHKKKKQRFRCRHISHRGGAGERLENTIPAFQHALDQETEMFETDVQLTKDGKVVVSHDNDLMRVTGVNHFISDYNYKDLPSLLPTQEVTFSNGATVTRKDDVRDIPLLESVFEAFPRMPINIDVKEHNEELIDKTIALVRKYNREDLTVLANFRSKTVNLIHQKAPDLMLAFSVAAVGRLLLLFYAGLLPFVPLKESFLEIPLPKAMMRKGRFSRWDSLIDWVLISPVLFRHLQRRGIQVYVFVINDEEYYEYSFSKLRVDGVMTDYPSKLNEYLKMKNAARLEKDEREEREESQPLVH